MDFTGVDSVELPQAGSQRPFSKYLEYKPGKTPANFAGSATAEQVNAGFSYYDKETATRVQLSSFRAIVVGQAMGAGGVTKDGARYINYYSNLVSNTKTDPLRIFMRGASAPIAEGLYQNIKADLPDGVGFKHYLIVYIPELNECAAMELTYGLQCCLQRIVAGAYALNSTGRKVPYNRVNMFALLDIQRHYYMFTFNGQFYRASKEADKYESGELYFYPNASVRMITDDKQLQFLDTHSEAITKWLESERDRVAGELMSQPVQPVTQPTKQPQPQVQPQVNQRADDRFPDLEPLSHDTDLPF